ncbi:MULTISPECIES: HNH endonuclease [Halorussus]|uniref:HNH endonuclease n=1 Tax=Halorussus TaxID=1070314 RepID=UPI00209D62B6|nr:HNH endonuclease [Halorussus vallis]USZ76003.1 HNH endonuclease [Halorussus vallis]
MQRADDKWCGSDNPNWNGGVDSEEFYGDGWPRARRRTLERDGHACQQCGADRDTLSQNPDVHHIRPVRTFEDPRDAHTLENLVCLCRDCHLAVERGNATLEASEQTIADLEAVGEATDDLSDAHQTLAQTESNLSPAEALKEDRKSRVDRLIDEQAQLEDAIDEERISDLEQQRDKAQNEVEDIESEKAELETERNKQQRMKGQIEGDLERLEVLREEQETLEAEGKQLMTAVEQCEAVEQMYGGLRASLREANVVHLEQLVNDVFSLVYENDSYARIELDRNYAVTIHEKSGETLDPDELSGGEQALFNLALRCAIYQLLAEGIDGEAPLPPLILDEPTVHLDETHVGRISDLAQRMRELGVDQTNCRQSLARDRGLCGRAHSSRARHGNQSVDGRG